MGYGNDLNGNSGRVVMKSKLKLRFSKKLKRELSFFDQVRALKLSTDIHNAEANGYEVSQEEDRLWLRLTDMIENRREASKKKQHRGRDVWGESDW